MRELLKAMIMIFPCKQKRIQVERCFLTIKQRKTLEKFYNMYHILTQEHFYILCFG